MNRNTKYLLGACAAVLLLGGTLAALLLTKPADSSGEASPVTDQIPILEKSMAQVTSIRVTNRLGTMTFLPRLPSEQAVSGYAAGLAAEGSASSGEPELLFEIEELNGLPTDTLLTSSTAENGYSLTAMKEFGAVEKPEDYGLNSPAATVESTFDDGSTARYEVGLESPETEGAYYVRKDGVVYVAPLDVNLFSGREAFVSNVVLQFGGTSTPPSFDALSFGGTAVEVPVPLEKTEDGFRIQSTRAPVDVNTSLMLTDMLTTLDAKSIEAVDADSAKLAEYGLDSPAHSLGFQVNGKAYTLLAGSREGTDCFIMLQGTPVVYRVEQERLKPWLGVTAAFDLRSKNLLVRNAEEVQYLELAAGEKTLTYLVVREEGTESTESGSPAYQYSVKKNGTDTADYTNEFQPVFARLRALTLLEAADGKPAGAPAYTARLQYFDGGSDTAEFYSIGDRRATVVWNGEVCGNVTDNDIQTIFGEMN